jgi:anionic cell wall polymer biosynthesis LytR-Cps2A-Psr (LCP) family protein
VICFEYPTRDVNTGLDQLPGCHRLSGLEALQYTRSRYYEEFRDGQWQTDPRSDLGRIERQQNFLQQTADATIRRLQSDPFLASELINAATASIRMDPNLDPINAAGTLRKAFSTGLAKYQLPVVGVERNGNAVLVLGDGAGPILDYFRGVGPPPPPADS